MSLMLLAATAATFEPVTAKAHSRVVCKRVWVHGHPSRRCYRVYSHRHHYRGTARTTDNRIANPLTSGFFLRARRQIKKPAVSGRLKRDPHSMP
ncbi:MAG: hypothetical protein CPDRYMAC_6290 [uncultured Paraburkholderia sp.]|nr:MAG: hypothetical protein CPDRYDRY_6214 [uncultured Paraburkholderia sp.]CAH2944043.1 MAG: hypothetical protein CPDRYMAC_6290 [uncultured Paraburkholderia sp.]